MSIRKLTIEQVTSIYKERMVEDFTSDELKPLSMIKTAIRHERYICFGTDDAYAFFVINGADALLDYFAVRRECRGQRYGGRFLKELMKEILVDYSHVLLETENPDFAVDEDDLRTRKRRLDFYL